MTRSFAGRAAAAVLTAATVVVLLVAAAGRAGAQAATLAVDQAEYAPGATVMFTGSGWEGCPFDVGVFLFDSGGNPTSVGLFTPTNGTFSGTLTAPAAVGTYVLDASGDSPGCAAQAPFEVVVAPTTTTTTTAPTTTTGGPTTTTSGPTTTTTTTSGPSTTVAASASDPGAVVSGSAAATGPTLAATGGDARWWPYGIVAVVAGLLLVLAAWRASVRAAAASTR